ncbi:alginate lyase family protein [Defluviitalea phaphyphila]|uniref:alginate lyase family protein n=1 Tax=Defluviitalea phaphyphila TaxID=1473580 RepID=UPI00073043DD|nr:alginate lyase family protein [Defluviitalea phaphyphila]
MLEKINEILSVKFKSLEDLLNHYRKVLPYRTRGYHQDEIGPIIPEDTSEKANKFLNREFDLAGYTVNMKDKLNWYATPTGDLEWNGGLVRHGHFVVMANEYIRTSDERFAKEIIDQMLDYIENVPVYDPTDKPYLEYKKSTWRPFEAAARMGETWPEALGKIINSKSMTAEAFAKILLSTYEHAKFIRKYHWKTGNHAVGEVASLGITSIFYSEFKEADTWRQYAVDFLMNMWDKLFNKDYYTNEMSGGYHWVAMRSFFAFYEVAKKNALEHIFPNIYTERLINASYAELYQEKPDYSIPVTNDSSSKTNRKKQLERIYNLFKLEEIKYRLTEGKEGEKPEYTSYFFKDSRIGIMRSDWTTKANYLFFDMGRWGDNHMNEDQLNIELSAYGRNILVNCGRWRYTTSPDVEWLDKAKYFKTTAAYNSLIVDGYPQLPGDAEGYMVIEEDYDFAEGIFNAGYGIKMTSPSHKTGEEATAGYKLDDITHTRQVIFIKPMFYIVRDIVNTIKEHEAEVIFHYREGDLLERDGVYITQFDDANLVLKTISDKTIIINVYKGSEEPFRGWHCPYYDQMEPAPELSIKQKGIGKMIFNTLLFPIKGKVKEIPKYEVTSNKHIVEYNNVRYTIEIGEKGICKIDKEKIKNIM